MTNHEVFACWAPEGGRWSPWVKPVVFANMAAAPYPTAIGHPAPELGEVVVDLPFDRSTAVIIDLPGAAGVTAGIALARKGFRPIPLHNAVPAPSRFAAVDQIPAMIDLRGVASALRNGTSELARLALAPDAPPAFLLDARRRIGDVGMSPLPGVFDNRSVSLPTDFPSANVLLSMNITRCVVVVSADAIPAPQPDLSHTLRRWQDAGVRIEMLRLGAATGVPESITIRKPDGYRHVWYAILARAGLRRHVFGGDGGVLPEHSTSSGG